MSRHSPVAPWVWLVACTICYSAMGILVFELVARREADIFWVGWTRFLAGTLAMLVPASLGFWRLRVTDRPLFVWRGTIGATGQFFLLLAIATVGLGRGTVMAYLMGVVGAVAGIVVLEERPTLTVAAALIGGTLGVGLACGGGWPAGGEWFGVLCALFSGTSLALIRRLRRTETNQVVFLSQCLFGLLMLSAVAPFRLRPLEASIWGLMLLMSGLDIAGQLCMTQGLGALPVAHSATLMMLTPLFSLLAGIGLFRETLSPGQLAGCLLILACSAVAASQPHRVATTANAQPPLAEPRPCD